jgi:hypothetical protein
MSAALFASLASTAADGAAPDPAGLGAAALGADVALPPLLHAAAMIAMTPIATMAPDLILGTSRLL